jgi:hypothetical protein
MGPTELLVKLADKAGLDVDDELRHEAQVEGVETEIKRAEADDDTDRADLLRTENADLLNADDSPEDDEEEPRSEVVDSVPPENGDNV